MGIYGAYTGVYEAYTGRRIRAHMMRICAYMRRIRAYIRRIRAYMMRRNSRQVFDHLASRIDANGTHLSDAGMDSRLISLKKRGMCS